MNKVSNNFQLDYNPNAFTDRKKVLNLQPSSLYSLALYDVDAVAQNEAGMNLNPASATPAFYPVDEYKDLSLKEILDISDDFLFGDDDPLMSARVYDTTGGAPSVATPERPPTSFNAEPTPVSPVSSMDATAPASKKRSREDFFDEEDEARRFRPYQAGQWTEKFDELVIFRRQHGHCLVAHNHKENLPLARWVKRQRYQYKLMREGKSSTMTEDRVQALEEIGFVWDSQRAAWEERLGELKDFRQIFYHTNVPSNYSENPQLATWVKCQRRQYKLYVEGKSSNMTPKRISQLESLGFEWELRSYKKARTC